MSYFVDRSGQLVEADPRDVGEYDALIAKGYAPATDKDIQRHNHAQDVAEQGGGTLEAIGTGAKQRLGNMVSLGEQAVQSVAPGFGTAPGLEPSEEGVAPTVGGAGLFPEAFSPRARLQQEANPIAFGLGQGLASAPLAGGLGAAAPAIAAVPIVGGTVGAVATEAAVEGALQEYDDAWLQSRPYDLQNVVTNTLMFGAFDLGFRGIAKGVGDLLFPGKPPELSIGRSNVVSEAEGEASRVTGQKRALRSVGAASSGDIQEPFDDAIKGMSDRDAAMLARDGDDHIHLIAQSASDDMTRINRGLDEDLGSHLKYEDFAKNAMGWNAKTMERQSKAIDSLLEQTDEAAQAIGRFNAGDQQAVDFGNIGKRIVQDINGFNTRIASEADPARRNILIDEFKKTLDRRMMGVDASVSVDRITRNELKDILRPLAGKEGRMRKMLEDDSLFPGNAEMQKDMNRGWHAFLEHWPAVSRELLEKTGNIQFDKSGAGRIVQESTVDRMRNLFSQDPRSIQEFGRHLRGAFDGLSELIGARETHGITATEGLPEMRQALANLMEDWNLASTIGVAKNRAKNLSRDPRKWAQIVGNMAERIPFGVGKAVEAVRTLGDVMPDLHLQRGTPLAEVWDAGYKRYATHPALQDPSISRNYADWVLDALNKRGGTVAPPQPGSVFGGGSGSAGVPRTPVEARAGLAQELRGTPKQSTPPVRAVTRPDIDPAFLERPIPTDDVFAPHVGTIASDGIFAERLSGPGGKTPGGFFRGKDGKIRYIKADKDPAHSAIEAGNAQMYRAMGRLVPDMKVVDLPGGEKAIASEYLGTQWRELDQLKDWTKLDPAVVRSYAEGVPVDVIMGNWDVSRNARNIMTDGTRTAMIDPGEAASNAWSAKWYKGNVSQTAKELQRTLDYGHGNPTLAPGDIVGKGAPHELLQGFAPTPGELSGLAQTGYERALKAIEDAGGVEKFVRQHQPTLTDAEVKRSAKEMKHRIAKLKTTIPTLGALLWAAFGGGEAKAAEDDRQTRRNAEQPSAAPVSPYRDALKNVDQAGRVELERMASALVRPRANRARMPADTLRAFVGSDDPRAAVEAAREALDRVGSDPRALIEQVAGASGDLAKTHPAVYQGIVAKAAQVSGYLRSVVPQRVGANAVDPRGSPMSLDEAYDFAARYAGAAWPRQTLRDVSRETASPEQVEAFKAVWPDRWEQYRMTAVGMVTRLTAAGRPLDSERLRRIDDMLELDGMLDSSASPDVARAMLAAQDAAGAKAQQPVTSRGGGSPSVAGSLSTRLQAINSERTQ